MPHTPSEATIRAVEEMTAACVDPNDVSPANVYDGESAFVFEGSTGASESSGASGSEEDVSDSILEVAYDSPLRPSAINDEARKGIPAILDIKKILESPPAVIPPPFSPTISVPSPLAEKVASKKGTRKSPKSSASAGLKKSKPAPIQKRKVLHQRGRTRKAVLNSGRSFVSRADIKRILTRAGVPSASKEVTKWVAEQIEAEVAVLFERAAVITKDSRVSTKQPNLYLGSGTSTIRPDAVDLARETLSFYTRRYYSDKMH